MTATANYWRPLANDRVACDLCPIGCRLRRNQDGPCGSRANREGKMELLQYGRIVSAAVDPVEKKPLYHFHPGRRILSVAAPGCNLHCLFCQNWTISQQAKTTTSATTPTDLASMAENEDALGIAYTYSEPLVWFEFVRETAAVCHDRKLKNVLVTNGFLNQEPLAELLPLIDAANVDLKSMDDRFYRRLCKASLEPVLAAIRQFWDAGVHLELTNLLIPGHNDSDEQITRLVDFIAGLDQAIPLHFSSYHPAWRLQAPPTPLATMQRAYAIASEKLRWVYLGNVATDLGRDTICRECGRVVVERRGYKAEIRTVSAEGCSNCTEALVGI